VSSADNNKTPAQQVGAEYKGIASVVSAVSQNHVEQYIFPQFMLFAIFNTITFFSFCYISKILL